jgi:HAD superfamily hydrolase (TIGR01509 family)
VIKALLFDFDGTLIDSESVCFRAWDETFRAHGVELALERWAAGIGTLDGFAPLDELEGLLGEIDRTEVDAARAARELELMAAEVLRPGVDAYLDDARRLGLATAIVSSSSRSWIDPLLVRLERSAGWGCLVCAEGDALRAKPAPTLYLEALQILGVDAHEAIAFEDSPNGVAAARAAGIFCVATPNPITAQIGVTGDLLLESFEELPLEELVALVEERAAA